MLDITEEGQATLDEARRTLCLPPDVTVELCAFVLHDSMNLLTDFPFNTKLSEYGFLVRFIKLICFSALLTTKQKILIAQPLYLNEPLK